MQFKIFIMLKLILSRNFLVIHHLMIIIVNMWVNIYEDSFVLQMMAYNYLTEFTTPFLNLSLYLYKNKKKPN